MSGSELNRTWCRPWSAATIAANGAASASAAW
jgi:hypothetical protein